MSKELVQKIVYGLVTGLISFLLAMNVYHSKGSHEEQKKINDNVIELNSNFVKFKTETIKDKDFILYRLDAHEDRIEILETKEI